MSNIIVTLKSLIGTLPDAEQRIAAYIVKNPEETPFLSIHKLAAAVGTSVASVTRLSQKTGCGSFKEMKIQLASLIDSGVSAVFDGIKADDSDDECIKKVFGQNILSLQDTLDIVDFPSIAKAAKKITAAERTIFIGLGSSGHIAGDGALRFAHLGLHTACYTDPLEMQLNCSLLDAKSVAVAFSHSGRTGLTIKAIRAAAERRATVVAVSNYPSSPLAKQSDIFLCTAFSESLTRASAVSSRISQICIMDALLVLTARRLSDKKTIDYANKIIEKEFRSHST